MVFRKGSYRKAGYIGYIRLHRQEKGAISWMIIVHGYGVRLLIITVPRNPWFPSAINAVHTSGQRPTKGFVMIVKNKTRHYPYSTKQAMRTFWIGRGGFLLGVRKK